MDLGRFGSAAGSSVLASAASYSCPGCRRAKVAGATLSNLAPEAPTGDRYAEPGGG
jgi:hypothetical protein